MSNQFKPNDYQPTRGGRGKASGVVHFDDVNQHLLEVGDKIPFVDSEDEDDNDDARGNSSDNTSENEDDIMTESQENLAMAYVNRFRMPSPSLAERRNQEKLTVTIEHERKPQPIGQ